MKKLTVSALALTIAALAQSAPAQADDAKTMAKNTAMVPVRTLGFGCAAVIGTPIAIARRTAVRVRGITGDFADQIGGKEHMPPVVGAAVLGVPFGILTGTSEGIFYGMKNAINEGFNKPFSEDSFSLGELE